VPPRSVAAFDEEVCSRALQANNSKNIGNDSKPTETLFMSVGLLYLSGPSALALTDAAQTESFSTSAMA
jgi:hypothetical protein